MSPQDAKFLHPLAIRWHLQTDAWWLFLTPTPTMLGKHFCSNLDVSLWCMYMGDAGLQFCGSVCTLPVTVAPGPLTCPLYYTMHKLHYHRSHCSNYGNFWNHKQTDLPRHWFLSINTWPDSQRVQTLKSVYPFNFGCFQIWFSTSSSLWVMSYTQKNYIVDKNKCWISERHLFHNCGSKILTFTFTVLPPQAFYL